MKRRLRGVARGYLIVVSDLTYMAGFCTGSRALAHAAHALERLEKRYLR